MRAAADGATARLSASRSKAMAFSTLPCSASMVASARSVAMRPRPSSATVRIESERSELARANPVAERVVVHADSIETLPFIPLGLNLLCERQGAIEQTQRHIETTDGVVCQRRVIDDEEV